MGWKPASVTSPCVGRVSPSVAAGPGTTWRMTSTAASSRVLGVSWYRVLTSTARGGVLHAVAHDGDGRDLSGVVEDAVGGRDDEGCAR